MVLVHSPKVKIGGNNMKNVWNTGKSFSWPVQNNWREREDEKIATAKLFVYHANTKARCLRRLRRLCSEPSHLNQYPGKFSGQKSCRSGDIKGYVTKWRRFSLFELLRDLTTPFYWNLVCDFMSLLILC